MTRVVHFMLTRKRSGREKAGVAVLNHACLMTEGATRDPMERHLAWKPRIPRTWLSKLSKFSTLDWSYLHVLEQLKGQGQGDAL